jgi:hypothetical protein
VGGVPRDRSARPSSAGRAAANHCAATGASTGGARRPAHGGRHNRSGWRRGFRSCRSKVRSCRMLLRPTKSSSCWRTRKDGHESPSPSQRSQASEWAKFGP